MTCKHLLRMMAASAVMALMLTPAPADIINLTPSQDATMVEDAAGALAIGTGSLFAGRTGQLPGTSIRRALVQFDVSSINPAATINSVTLTLVSTTPTPSSVTVNLHKLTTSWTEGPSVGQGTGGGGGDTAVTGDVTWLHRTFNTLNWTTAGGDFTGTPSASQTVNLNGTYNWTSAQMLADVQDWVNNPGNNFGWILIGDESAVSTAHRFDSTEAGVDPVLQIDVTPPSSVDEWSLY